MRPPRAHAGAGHADGPAIDCVSGNGLRRLTREMQRGQVEGIMPLLKQLGGIRLKGIRITPEDFRRRDCHGRVEVHRCRTRDPPLSNALAQEVEQLLHALQSELSP